MTRTPLHLPIRDQQIRLRLLATSRRIAWVSGAFCLVLATGLVFLHLNDRKQSPLVAERPAKLMAELVSRPEDEALKDEIRALDTSLRQGHFDRRARIQRGGFLLLGGLIVLVLSLKASTQWEGTVQGALTAPGGTRPDTRRASVLSGAAVASMGGALAIVLLMVGRTTPPDFCAMGGVKQEAVDSIPLTPITDQQWARNWTSFRGPRGDGSMFESTAPMRWDAATGEGVIWKTPVPLPGPGTPVVWEGLVFLSGASVSKQEVYCFDATTGTLKWKRDVKGPVAGSSLTVNEDTGYAAPSMATDGHRVYAMFATGDIAAFELSGKPAWSRNLGKPDSLYGHSASLVAEKDGTLFVQFDQGVEESEGKSALLALDGATGVAKWKVSREVRNSWSSPIIVQTPAGRQLVTAAAPWVIAYDPADGRQLWKAAVLDGDVGPSPAYGAGMVFVANEGSQLAAIRTDGTGDVTATHVAWTSHDALPNIVTPLATEQLLLMPIDFGTIHCFEAATGKVLWSHETAASFHSSPVRVGKHAYLTDTSGLTWVLELGDAYKELAKCPLAEPVSATPVLVGGRWYIRSKDNLYCLGVT